MGSLCLCGQPQLLCNFFMHLFLFYQKVAKHLLPPTHLPSLISAAVLDIDDMMDFLPQDGPMFGRSIFSSLAGSSKRLRCWHFCLLVFCFPFCVGGNILHNSYNRGSTTPISAKKQISLDFWLHLICRFIACTAHPITPWTTKVYFSMDSFECWLWNRTGYHDKQLARWDRRLQKETLWHLPWKNQCGEKRCKTQKKAGANSQKYLMICRRSDWFWLCVHSESTFCSLVGSEGSPQKRLSQVQTRRKGSDNFSNYPLKLAARPWKSKVGAILGRVPVEALTSEMWREAPEMK